MKRFLAYGILMVVFSGCATATQRIVAMPTQGQTAEQMAMDKVACEVFASENRNNDRALEGAGMGVLVGAGAGAAIGAVSGAVTGFGAGRGSLIGMALYGVTGLIVGTVSGAANDYRRYVRVYSMCMSLRGYAVTD